MAAAMRGALLFLLIATAYAVPTSATAAVSQRELIATARTAPAVRQELTAHPGIKPMVVRLATGTEVRWINARGQGVAVAMTPDGRIEKVWTGYQATWELTRGEGGAVDGAAGNWWIWIPLGLIFAAAFADRTRIASLRNADVVALLGLSASLAWFEAGDMGLAVPLFYPPLGYLLWRLLRRGGRSEDPAPSSARAIGRMRLAIPPLILLRVVLNFASTYKLDVAGFSPLGADRFAHWASFYGNTPNPAGDHYGPVVYLAYVPFELVWPYHGEPDPLATHFANLTFDLLTALIIFRLARRLGGTGAGIAATFAWLSLPLTLLALCSGSNDGLVALLMVGALAVVGRPVLAGALTGAAALTKIAPALAIPAIAVHPGIADPSLHRRLLRFLPAVAAVVCVVVAFVLKTTPLSTFLDRTLHSQENLFSPLSIWSFYDPAATSPVLYDLQSLVRAAAAALAVILAIWPRQRDTAQLAALCGAVLIAAQLGATYWIYPYAVWFLPLALVALLSPCRRPPPARPRRVPPRSRVWASAPS